MAEKRRSSARERREPAAKRRASEAAPASQSSKKKASIPTAAPSPTPAPAPEPEPEPEVVEKPLPTKIKDGEGLPTLSSPQSETLSDKEYQSIAESAVLLVSLERSKKKWLSDGILVRYWTKPKKTKREQIEGKNPPKESMSKVGPCSIVVGPHLFDAMLYTVKDPNAPPPIQYTPPQRPMVHYGHPNNFQQYHPYPSPAPPQHGRQHPPQTPPTHASSPQPGHQPNSHPPPPPPNRTPNHPTPRPAAPPPAPGPQSAQRPSPSQQPQPPQPAKPSPDPVIQMLATRAASDPDLKALMRVVASSKASQEQLRAFQAHIDELNAIIRAREQQQQRQQQQLQQSNTPTAAQSQASPRTPQPTPQQQTSQPQPSQRPPQSAQQSGQQAGPQPPQNPPLQQKQSTPKSQPTPSQALDQSYSRVEVQIPSPSSTRATPSKAPPQTPNTQKPGSTPQVKQEPGTTGQPPNVEPSPAVRPMPPPQQTPGTGPRSGPQHPSHQPQQPQPHQGHPPAIQSRPPQFGSPTPYYRPAPPPPPPRMNFKSVVFEFTSPLTPYGSSTSGHAGSGDRYLFPEYTILEWLPGGNTVLASFLLIKKVDPNLPFPIETAPDAGSTRAKGKSGSRSKKSDKRKARDKEKEEKEKEKEKKEESKAPDEKDKSNAQSASTPQDPSSTESKQPAAEGDNPAGEQNQQKDQANATPSKADTDKQPSKEKSEEAKDTSNLKEYYQPVTFRIHSTNPKVLEPLNRVVKPADEVRKYMNEVMDRAERAPDGFLAYRLPREEIPEEPEAEETKKAGTPVPVSTGRKPSRGKAAVDESDVENNEFVEKLDEEEEEELKDFYGAPTGLLPMAPM